MENKSGWWWGCMEPYVKVVSKSNFGIVFDYIKHIINNYVCS